MSHWIEDIAPYIALLEYGAVIFVVILGAHKLHVWLKRRGRPHVVPYISGVVVSFVVFSGCALIFQLFTGPIGFHQFNYESGSFWTDNFMFIVGSSGALLAVLLILLSRKPRWIWVRAIVGAILLLCSVALILTDAFPKSPFVALYSYIFVIPGLILLVAGAGDFAARYRVKRS